MAGTERRESHGGSRSWTPGVQRPSAHSQHGLRPGVADDLTAHERALMGFKAWETCGTSDEFGAEWACPGKDSTGGLR